jgi:hypothetical protein
MSVLRIASSHRNDGCTRLCSLYVAANRSTYSDSIKTNDCLISCQSLPPRWTCPLQCVSVDRLLLGMMMMLIRNVSYAERKEGESFGEWSTGTSFPFPEH